MFLDTADGPVLGLHLGMSGRVIVDDDEAGDPLDLREQPAASRRGIASACASPTAASFMLRDPRRLGAVELDPDESRLGPDAFTLTLRAARPRARRSAPRRSRRC